MKFSIFLFVVLNLYMLHTNGFRVFNRNGAVTIMASENEKVNIKCQPNVPMTYCGFIHPSGKRYTFSGHDLDHGCTVTINATLQDDGRWSCHVGNKTVGVETVQTIYLRVDKQLAAIQPHLSVVKGKEVTLECATVKRMVSMKYCRFEPPNGSPFRLKSSITEKNPILGNYYFPLNKSIERGDCAVTIRKAQIDDQGVWTCAAGLGDGKEYIDRIKLQIEAPSSEIIAVAIAIIFLLSIGYLMAKKKCYLAIPRIQPQQVIEEQEMGTMRRTPSRLSPELPRPVPSLSVPYVTVPSVTVPSVTVPSMTVPSVTVQPPSDSSSAVSEGL